MQPYIIKGVFASAQGLRDIGLAGQRNATFGMVSWFGK